MVKPKFHRRSPELTMVRYDEIAFDPDFKHDPFFQKLFINAQLGKTCVSMTRVRADLVTSGFYVRESGITVHSSNVKDGDLDFLRDIIRQGDRPALHLYWSPLCDKESKLVCPDDEMVLAAYRSLGITYVPAFIYDPAEVRRDEGALWTRNVSNVWSYVRALGPRVDAYLASRRADDLPASEALAMLVDDCARTRAAVRDFHLERKDGVHYHQMLHARLLRHERALRTIGELLSTGRVEHACALVRMVYEAFLGFYVDWLSPSFVGPRLQAVSHVGPRKSPFATTIDPETQKAISKGLGGFERLLTSVVEKARVSALGERFYNAVYPELSRFAHQAYGVLENEALDFEDDAPPDDELARYLLIWLNVITTALVFRISNEVGHERRPT